MKLGIADFGSTGRVADTNRVGELAPNKFGVCDTTGIVDEWVADCHAASQNTSGRMA